MSSSWQLQPIFGSYLLVALMSVGLLGLLWISPAFGKLPNYRRRWLWGLRGALVVLLAITMLRPALVVTNQQAQQSLVAVLFDTSRSMDYRDGEGGQTRWQEQVSLLRKTIPQLENLGEGFEVELIGFAGQTDPQPKEGDQLKIAAQPQGSETNIGQAIADTLQRHRGRRLAGVVLLSDGAQRAMVTEISPQQAARQLDRRATPLYTIAMGRDRDQSQARDVAIENLLDEYSVFVKNEFALRVGVRIQGYANQPIPVTLFVEDASGNREQVGIRELIATQESQVVMADFEYRAEQAGKFRLHVQAEPQAGELTENNQAVAFLDVRDGGLRVLFLSGAVLFEEPKFIRRSLAASREIELDYQRFHVNTRDRWPIDLSSRVKLEDYDVFLVGDLDASAIRTEDWETMAKLVEAGRGFMMFGGYHSFGPGGYANTPIANVLPVQLDVTEREQDPTTNLRHDRHQAGEVQIVPVADSPITHLVPGETENKAKWASLKPMSGANKLDKLKDQATVIAESSQGDGILVQSNYVAGRVLASAVDSTYRWWTFGQQDVHKRFWRQCVLWLARRDKQEANSVFIHLPQRRYMAGSKIQFLTGLTDEAGDTILDAPLQATWHSPDGQVTELPLVKVDDGFQGAFVTDQDIVQGVHRIHVSTAQDTTSGAQNYAEVVILKEDFELTDPAANPGLLDMLARMTARVGGKSLAPEQLSDLIEEIKSNPPPQDIAVQSKWQLGDGPWDAWACFLLLTVLLSADWILRKQWGLV